MIDTLITFIGRGQSGPAGGPGYKRVQYVMPDGMSSEPVSFVGWTLAKYRNPSNIVIIGTATSSWDQLFESDLNLGSKEEDARLALQDAVHSNRGVTQADLDQLMPTISEAAGVNVSARIIPYCYEKPEQVELVRMMANSVADGAKLDLDVTHSFRHLPLIAMFAAIYLRRVKNVDVSRIWYGEFSESFAKIHDLAGILAIADWTEALSRYDQDGDAGSCADLLPDRIAQSLSRSAFYENVNRVRDARGPASSALAALNADKLELDATAELFKPQLTARLEWSTRDKLSQRQRELAQHRIEHHKFMEAVIFLYEAFVTRQTE